MKKHELVPWPGIVPGKICLPSGRGNNLLSAQTRVRFEEEMQRRTGVLPAAVSVPNEWLTDSRSALSMDGSHYSGWSLFGGVE